MARKFYVFTPHEATQDARKTIADLLGVTPDQVRIGGETKVESSGFGEYVIDGSVTIQTPSVRGIGHAQGVAENATIQDEGKPWLLVTGGSIVGARTLREAGQQVALAALARAEASVVAKAGTH